MSRPVSSRGDRPFGCGFPSRTGDEKRFFTALALEEKTYNGNWNLHRSGHLQTTGLPCLRTFDVEHVCRDATGNHFSLNRFSSRGALSCRQSKRSAMLVINIHSRSLFKVQAFESTFTIYLTLRIGLKRSHESWNISAKQNCRPEEWKMRKFEEIKKTNARDRFPARRRHCCAARVSRGVPAGSERRNQASGTKHETKPTVERAKTRRMTSTGNRCFEG